MSHESHDSVISMESAFTDQQWQDFRREDTKAGAAVVMLMLCIFLIGVVLYSIVVAAVSS
jgi:hypothetical protein